MPRFPEELLSKDVFMATAISLKLAIFVVFQKIRRESKNSNCLKSISINESIYPSEITFDFLKHLSNIFGNSINQVSFEEVALCWRWLSLHA